MAHWKQALDKFIKKWKKKRNVIGAVATGSYALGTATKYSDIDVHIILSNKVNYRERGNKRVNGFVIEYFANPPKMLKKYLEEDYLRGTKTDARMFATGEILFDKTGEVKTLQENAKKLMKKKIKKATKQDTELAKYHLWDQLEDLKDIHEQKSPNYSFLYNLLLERAIDFYTSFTQEETPPLAKLHRFLDEPQFRRKYKMKQWSDKQFSQYVKKCLQTQSIREMQKLIDHVLQKMGGFDIDGWKLRTKIEE